MSYVHFFAQFSLILLELLNLRIEVIKVFVDWLNLFSLGLLGLVACHLLQFYFNN